MKQNHVHNSLMILGVFIFLLTASLYVYMYLAVDSQTEKVVTTRDSQRMQELDSKQVESLKTVFKNSEKSRADLKNLFVPRDSIVNFIESLESLGTQTGSTVELSSVSETRDGTSVLGKFKAHIEAKGSWSQVMKVLMLVETMQKVVSVDSVRLNSLGTSDDKTKNYSWGLSLNINASTIQ